MTEAEKATEAANCPYCRRKAIQCDAALLWIDELGAARDKFASLAEVRETEADRMRAERDEAIRTRNLAQEASTRDLEAKRAVEARLRDVGEQLEFDRTAVADCLSAANKAIDGRHWLTEGRGPYEWDDDNWHEEFYAAAIEIKTALEPLTKIATNWKDCPQSAVEVARARVDLRTELRAAVDALKDLLEDGGLACIDHAERIVAAYDAKRPEGK